MTDLRNDNLFHYSYFFPIVAPLVKMLADIFIAIFGGYGANLWLEKKCAQF